MRQFTFKETRKDGGGARAKKGWAGRYFSEAESMPSSQGRSFLAQWSVCKMTGTPYLPVSNIQKGGSCGGVSGHRAGYNVATAGETPQVEAKTRAETHLGVEVE